MAMFLMMNPPRKKRGRKGRRRGGRCPSGAGYAQRLASGKHAGKRLHAFLKRFRSARRKYGAVRKQKAFRAEMRKPLMKRSYATPKWKRSLGSYFGTSSLGKGAANPRKRRRSRRRNYSHWIPDYTMSVASNPYWIPRYAMNPGGGVVGGATGLVKRAFSPNYAINAAAVGVGIGLNAVVTPRVFGAIAGKLPMLRFLRSNALGRLASGLLMSAGALLLPTKLRGSLAAGMAGGAMWDALAPIAGKISGLGDYLTVGDAASARALGGLGCMGAGCLGQMTIADEIATNGYALEASSGTDSTTPESFGARILGGNVHNASNTYPSVPLLGLGMDNIQRTATEELATS